MAKRFEQKEMGGYLVHATLSFHFLRVCLPGATRVPQQTYSVISSRKKNSSEKSDLEESSFKAKRSVKIFPKESSLEIKNTPRKAYLLNR